MSGLTSLMNNITGRRNKKSPYTIIHLAKTGEQEPRYYFFKTQEVKEYLKFLEKFDETKYQIVDISVSMSALTYGIQEFYMITYKNIE